MGPHRRCWPLLMPACSPSGSVNLCATSLPRFAGKDFVHQLNMICKVIGTPTAAEVRACNVMRRRCCLEGKEPCMGGSLGGALSPVKPGRQAGTLARQRFAPGVQRLARAAARREQVLGAGMNESLEGPPLGHARTMPFSCPAWLQVAAVPSDKARSYLASMPYFPKGGESISRIDKLHMWCSPRCGGGASVHVPAATGAPMQCISVVGQALLDDRSIDQSIDRSIDQSINVVGQGLLDDVVLGQGATCMPSAASSACLGVQPRLAADPCTSPCLPTRLPPLPAPPLLCSVLLSPALQTCSSTSQPPAPRPSTCWTAC